MVKSNIMDVNDIIKEELNKFINGLGEEYNSADNIVYGYHVTSKRNLESINDNGFNIGNRAMQGKGFYAFYDYDHAMRYLMKGEISNPVIVKFAITCKTCFLYLNMEIAKEVLGESYHLKDQINNYFKSSGGMEYILSEARNVYNRNMTMEDLLVMIDKIENDNTESNQRSFVFNLISSNLNDRLNIVWNGNYGLEYRINIISITKPIGYYDYKDVNGRFTGSYFDFKAKSVELPLELKDFINDDTYYDFDNISKDEVLKLINNIETKIYNTRNNREYDYFNNILELLKTVK